MCLVLKKKGNTVANNKVCPVCSKVISENSNRGRHVKNFHQDSEDDIVIDNQRDEDTQNEIIPSMVLVIDNKSPQVSLPKYLCLMMRMGNRLCCPQVSKWKICRVEIQSKIQG